MTENNTITVGVDIGSESTKVVLGSNHDCEIVRNEIGGHVTPTALSFDGRNRLIGEAANLKSVNAVVQLNRLLLLPHCTAAPRGEEENLEDPFSPFYRFQQDERNLVTVDYNGVKRGFEASALIAMLLGKIHENVKATVDRIQQKKGCNINPDENSYRYVFSVPPGLSVEKRDALVDGAFVAGLGEDVQVMTSAECAAAAYQRKFPDDPCKCVLVVDMGHTETFVSVLRINQHITGDATNDVDEEKKEASTASAPPDHDAEEKKLHPSSSTQVVKSVCQHALGAGCVDVRLFEHFQSSMPTVLASVSKSSRSGQRLLDGCHKLKHTLSQLPDGTATIENVGENDVDVRLKCTRAKLAELCTSEANSLKQLILQALEEASDDGEKLSVDAVEVAGGGCRIPWVKSIILEAMESHGINKSLSLSYSLDDTSLALGAALLGSYEDKNVDVADADTKPAIDASREEHRMKLREAEQKMFALDKELTKIADIRNQIEAHVLEMRSARHTKHGSLLPAQDVLDAHLNQADDWLFSEEAERATHSEMEDKLSSTLQITNDMCKSYTDAVKKEAEVKEQEMEEEAKRNQAERDTEEPDEEDHDNRRLPKKRRMEIVLKNKNEANELFGDGNYRHAAARYTKALSHCSKFVDLSPEDTKEVNGVKLSLNLNLSLAYLKLEKLDQALRVCNEALHVDAKSAKALYRRATVYYEKKKWDDANKDLQTAMDIAPDDKAIKKLHGRVELQMKKQKAKQKKMAQKMFG